MKPLIFTMVFCLEITICCAQEATPREAGSNEQLVGFQWLELFEGDWVTEHNGTMSSRTIGERWIVNEISFPNGVYSVQTLGYDKKKNQFIGTWIDASSSYIWRYTGSLDAKGKVLVLEAEGPDLNDPAKMRLYRDTYEFSSKNEITATSQMLNAQKQWHIFNKSKMTRKIQ